MKRSLLFPAVLGGMLTAAPAMAEDVGADFHALSAMSKDDTEVLIKHLSTYAKGEGE